MGTSGYMSPEQTLGEPVDARSDIFSLGVLLYEMVAGRPPFQGKTDSHVKVSIMDQEPAHDQPVVAVPRQLERIVSKALAKDKKQRYQTATDLKLDLEQLREELRTGDTENALICYERGVLPSADPDDLATELTHRERRTIATLNPCGLPLQS